MRQLGPYRLIRELARGGMGAVHEVVHVETGTRYALKTILPDLLGSGDAEELKRFRREAEVMAKLDHPHVARVHTASLEGPTPFLVQDLLPGGTLRDRIKAGAVPVPDVVQVSIKLARALQHCHSRGVLHRDLTPRNVLFNDRGEPVLVDFGLALLTGSGQRLTQTGTVLGTPGYMAPEQARGEKTLDARTDVYGLGAILYALLTGHEPFRGGAMLMVLDKVVNRPPEPVRTTRPDVPRWLERVCLQALAKNPQDRFADAGALADALEQGARAAPPSRLWLVTAAVVAVAGLFGILATSRPTPDPKPEPEPAKPAEVPLVPAQSPPTVERPRPRVRTGAFSFPNARKQMETRGLFDGEHLVGVTTGGVIGRWRLDKPRHFERLASFDPQVKLPNDRGPLCLFRTPGGWVVATRGGDLCLVPSAGPVRRLIMVCRWIERKGALLAVAAQREGLVLVDLDSFTIQRTFSKFDELVEAVAFLDDGRLAACTKNELSVWDLGRVESTPVQIIATKPVFNSASMFARAGRVALGARNGLLRVFHAPAHAELTAGRTFESDSAFGAQHDGSVRVLAISLDGATLFSVGHGANMLKAWGMETSRLLSKPLPCPGRVVSMTMDPSGAYLVLGTARGELTVLSISELIGE